MVERVPPASDDEDALHAHPAVVHDHLHYHVTHHHREGMALGEWAHQTSEHAHRHNHAPLEHRHDYDVADEEREHDQQAHVHDHESPADSPA